MNRIHWFTLVMLVAIGSTSFAQDKRKDAPTDKKNPTPIAPAEKLADGWGEIDERLIFLMVRLADTESSLEAVEKVIASNSRKQSVKTGDAKRAIGENEKMDQKGGGPMKWSQFYGTTAEKFFYHPTDRNSTYHTVTVLSPQPPQNDNQAATGIPSRQGLPVHQRPPQFDYIYKANRDAASRADAEAAQLKNKIEALTARQRKLELEQVALWVEIAFRAAAHFDLDKKPMFRFEPLVVGNDAEAKLHADILKSAASFMRVALSIIEEANRDQAGTLLRIKPAVKQARQTLNDSWLRLAVDNSNKKTAEGRFAALAKRLDDVSSNLTESYEVATEGDEEKDQLRKNTFRGQLQQSLVSYAQIVLALDEMATEMKDQWKINPDLEKPFRAVSLASVTSKQPIRLQQSVQIAKVTELDANLKFPPWVSDDGLTIYWEDFNSGIWTARRVLGGVFTGKTELLKGRHPTVSGDGLEIVFLASPAGNPTDTSLHIAVRQSTNQAFGRPTEISELRTATRNPKCPCLSHDGLTLYFNTPLEGGDSDLLMSKRKTRQSPWDKGVPVPGLTNKKSLTWACVSSDELRLFCSDESQDRSSSNKGNLMIWQRADLSKPFVEKEYIEMASLPALSGRGPRYVAATGELFFARKAQGLDPNKWDGIWILKGYDLRAPAR